MLALPFGHGHIVPRVFQKTVLQAVHSNHVVRFHTAVKSAVRRRLRDTKALGEIRIYGPAWSVTPAPHHNLATAKPIHIGDHVQNLAGGIVFQIPHRPVTLSINGFPILADMEEQYRHILLVLPSGAKQLVIFHSHKPSTEWASDCFTMLHPKKLIICRGKKLRQGMNVFMSVATGCPDLPSIICFLVK